MVSGIQPLVPRIRRTQPSDRRRERPGRTQQILDDRRGIYSQSRSPQEPEKHEISAHLHSALIWNTESRYLRLSNLRVAEVKEDRQHGHKERMGPQTRSVHEIGVQPWRPQSVLYHHKGRGHRQHLGSHVLRLVRGRSGHLDSGNDVGLPLDHPHDGSPYSSSPRLQSPLVHFRVSPPSCYGLVHIG